MSILAYDIQASEKLISHLEQDENTAFDKSKLEEELKQKQNLILPSVEELSLLE